MKTTVKNLVSGALVMAGATAATTQTFGETILGIEVNVAKIVTKGYSGNELIGAIVHNDHDKRIGHIHDLILGKEGDQSLAILEVGGVLGLGSKWVAVPADLFESNGDGHIVLTNATEDELSKVPPSQFAQQLRMEDNS